MSTLFEVPPYCAEDCPRLYRGADEQIETEEVESSFKPTTSCPAYVGPRIANILSESLVDIDGKLYSKLNPSTTDLAIVLLEESHTYLYTCANDVQAGARPLEVYEL